jgi:hypothetical protein
MGEGGADAYWMMMLLAPLTIRIPLPLMTPADPEPMRDLLDFTVIPRTPALSLNWLVWIFGQRCFYTYYLTVVEGADAS